MERKFLLHALTAAGLSGLACIIYNAVYKTSFNVDFSPFINEGSILGACLFACTLIAAGHFIIFNWQGNKLIGVYNLLVLALSFSGILGVLAFSLPLNFMFPELFPGLAIPMLFFPALAYFASAIFFQQSK